MAAFDQEFDQNSLARTLPAETPAVQRVLVVDDSRLQRRILTALLKSAGYVVIQAESGQQALEICQHDPPDLVLSDWVMPGMDGLEFCREFRSLPGDRYGYFILLTSKSEKDEVARGFESGADDFLTKPVNAHELRARITAGERILRMQRELTQKNRVISDTLTELQRLYDAVDHDLIEAEKLQLSLVRDRYLDFGRGAAAFLFQSCGRVGGDLVGYYRIGDDRLAVYSIDVSGHGISSALMTARLAGYLSSSSPEQNVALRTGADGKSLYLQPDEVVARLNQIILADLKTEHYFTMLLAEINLDTGRVVMAQAGHPHPVILRQDGQIEQSGPGGFPVGLMNDAAFSRFEARLGPGDRLLILSDGVVECTGKDGQLLGEAGFADMLTGRPDIPVGKMPELIMDFLCEFAGSDEFTDDVSGVVFEYRG